MFRSRPVQNLFRWLQKRGNKYDVSDLPTPMWHEVHMPPPASCGEYLTSYVEIDIWVNSDLGGKVNGGNSLLHKDVYNTINCVVNGTKEWKLIGLKYNDYVYQSWGGHMDAGYGGFSIINPDKVNSVFFEIMVCPELEDRKYIFIEVSISRKFNNI